MTLAVIKTGGKQYKITEEQAFNIEKIKGVKGDKVVFDEVLLLSDEKGENVQIGTPFLEGTTVEAEIVLQGRDKKITVIKYKRKTRYRRKQGHKQPHTRVKILKIGGSVAKATAKKVVKKVAEKKPAVKKAEVKK